MLNIECEVPIPITVIRRRATGECLSIKIRLGEVKEILANRWGIPKTKVKVANAARWQR